MGEGGSAHELIHLAVAARAVERPEAVALVRDGIAFSYSLLNAASDTYAALLAEQGVRPGQIVPFLLPRSPQLVALQLAVLKCGAAYVNLDGAWPVARQQTIMEQIRPRLVVARDASTLPKAVEVLDPGEDDLTRSAGRRTEFTPATVASGDPATVFFTSGTTGGPKGIIVPHRAVTRLFRPGGLTGFGHGHATPQAAALAWDMYAFEVWGQLTAGGTVVFAKGGHLMPGALRELIDKADVDTVWLTATLFNVFVDEDPECFDGIRQMYIGGEKLSPAHVRTFLRRYPSVPLYNGYGPAENCMLTTTRLIESSDCEVAEGIPVGVSVPGSEVLVLGELERQCAPREVGEVCAAGEGLAIGYLGQPSLTAEKFPTVQIDGAPKRIYRTGDVGFLDDVGVLHYRGRRDRQVKISGHRIELAEIEAAARELDAVRDCVAVPLKDDDSRVVGIALCYTAEHEQTQGTEAEGMSGWRGSSESEVRKALRRVLPAHLIPGVVRKFDRFPVTSNGKVDLAMLGSLARTHSVAVSSKRALK